MQKLDNLSRIIKPSSRVRYIIVNLLEMRKNKWPESKSKREGPKTIEQLYQDIENERLSAEANLRAYNRHEKYYKNTYYDYGEYEDAGYEGRQYRSPKSKMYRKTRQSKGYETKAYEVERNEMEEEKEAEKEEEAFDKDEFMEKIITHLENYTKDPKEVSFEEYRDLAKKIPAPEFVTSLFKSLVNNGIITTKMQTDKEFLGKYLYSFSTNNIYSGKGLIQGFNSYIQLSYENDCEDNMNLKDVVASVYIQGLISQRITFDDIQLWEHREDEEITVYVGRIGLGCDVAAGISEAQRRSREAWEFFEREVRPMVDKSDESELDEETIRRTEEMLESGATGEMMQRVVRFLEAENEKGFSETPTESIGSEEDAKDPLFSRVVGEAIVKVILKDSKLNVLFCDSI